MELTTACVNGDEVGYEADIVEYRRADWRRREFIDNAVVDLKYVMIRCTSGMSAEQRKVELENTPRM